MDEATVIRKTFHGIEHIEFDKEKFAQLIVQECMCISDSIGEHGYIAAEEMGKHFGVEE